MKVYWSDYEALLLLDLFPILDRSIMTSCPNVWCSGRNTIMGMLQHLNDTHRWPRCESDRNDENQHLPTILGWLQEEAEKNGWDLTCRPLSK